MQNELLNPNNKKIIKSYLDYLIYEKKYSKHTFLRYQQVCLDYGNYLEFQNLSFLNGTEEIIKMYIKQLYDKQYSPSTISNYISVLKGLYKYFINKELINTNPMEHIIYPKKDKKLVEVIYTSELKEFFNYVALTKYPKRNKAIFYLLYSSGIRISECINLELNDLKMEENLIKIKGKGNKQRLVPLNQQTKKSLLEYINKERTQLKKNETKIFLNKDDNPLTPKGIRYIINNICKQAGIQANITPHKFRHTLATNLLNSGMDLRHIQEILGHSSLQTSEKYLKVSKNKMQKEYNKIMEE